MERIKRLCGAAMGSLTEAEITVVIMGLDFYLDHLDLDNDDADCWKMPSGDNGFHGWNPQCIPTLEYIEWKLKRLEEITSK